MQKIATRVFIYASIAFGILGILMILTTGPDGDNSIVFRDVLIRNLLFIHVFIILSSFAVSIAGKYLNK